MLPGATCGICRQHAGDVWRILAPCAGPPPGLEQLQLDNHVRFTVRQMKRELANELGKAFPELLQAQDDGDLVLVQSATAFWTSSFSRWPRTTDAVAVLTSMMLWKTCLVRSSMQSGEVASTTRFTTRYVCTTFRALTGRRADMAQRSRDLTPLAQ
jgi:hypothetical protein